MATVTAAVHFDENTCPQPENVQKSFATTKLLPAAIKPASEENPTPRGQKRLLSGDAPVEQSSERESTSATYDAPLTKRRRVGAWLVDSSAGILAHARPLSIRAAMGAKELATKVTNAGAQASSLALEMAATTRYRITPYAMQAATSLADAMKGCTAVAVNFAQRTSVKAVKAQVLASAKAEVQMEMEVASESDSAAFSPPREDGYEALPSPEEKFTPREDGYEALASPEEKSATPVFHHGSRRSLLLALPSPAASDETQAAGDDFSEQDEDTLANSEQDAGWMLTNAEPRVWQCPSSGAIYHFSEEHRMWMPAEVHIPDQGQWQ